MHRPGAPQQVAAASHNTCSLASLTPACPPLTHTHDCAQGGSHGVGGGVCAAGGGEADPAGPRHWAAPLLLHRALGAGRAGEGEHLGWVAAAGATAQQEGGRCSPPFFPICMHCRACLQPSAVHRPPLPAPPLPDVLTVLASYFVMLAYIAAALGRFPRNPNWWDVLVHSRQATGRGLAWGLGWVGGRSGRRAAMRLASSLCPTSPASPLHACPRARLLACLQGGAGAGRRPDCGIGGGRRPGAVLLGGHAQHAHNRGGHPLFGVGG